MNRYNHPFIVDKLYSIDALLTVLCVASPDLANKDLIPLCIGNFVQPAIVEAIEMLRIKDDDFDHENNEDLESDKEIGISLIKMLLRKYGLKSSDINND